MNDWIAVIVVIAVLIAFILIVMSPDLIGWWLQREEKKSLEKFMRTQRIRIYICIGLIIMAIGGIYESGMRVFCFASLFILGCLTAIAWYARNLKSHKVHLEVAREMYADDPSQCPFCAYSFRGMKSGECPECGWQLPATADKGRKINNEPRLSGSDSSKHE